MRGPRSLGLRDRDGSLTYSCQETSFVLGSLVFDLLVRKQTRKKPNLYKYPTVIMWDPPEPLGLLGIKEDEAWGADG